MDALLQQVGDQQRQPDRRVDKALGHLRVLVELPPRLALLERAAAEASPLRHVDRDLGRVHVRVLRVPHDLLDHLDLRDVVLRSSSADVEDAGPRRLQLDLGDLVVVFDRVDRDGRLLGLQPIVMVLREGDADGRIVEGGHEVRDALSIAGADEGVRVLGGDLPHLPEEFPRAVWPHLEAVREVRDLVVAFSEEGLVREGIVDAVEEMLPEDDIIRLRRGRIVAVAVGLVVIVIGDRARRHDDVDEAELHHVAHDLAQAAGCEGSRAAEEHGAFRVRHRVLEDGGTEAQGPGLERDPLVSIHEVGDGRRFLEVQVLDRDRGQLRLRGLVHRHGPAQCGHPPKGFGSSGFLLAFDRFRDGPGLLLRPRADRVLVAVEEHVEVGLLPLDVLYPLHDVLEGDRLVVRVDPYDNPFLALRPHGPPLFGSPQDTVRFVPAYKDSSGVRPRVAERTSRPSSLALDCCMIMPSSRLNTLGTASDGDRILHVGRVREASGGAAPMAVKPADSTVAQQVCRVCGGEVNPHGECVVCGTKQDAPTTTDKGLPSWLKNESGEASTWLSAPGTGDSRDEALRKWLSGEDTAFQDWIGVPTTSGGGLAARVTSDRMSDDKVRELRSKAMEVGGMRAELESMRATLNGELSNFRQGKFDPVKYIEEIATLSKQLKTEIGNRKELDQDYLAKEEQFKKRIISLEGDVNRYKIEDKVRAQAQAFEGKPKTELGGALTKKEHDVLQRERTLLLREQDLQRLQDDLEAKEDEIKKVKEPLAYKEEELLRREEDMLYREKLVQAERRKVEEAKAQGGSTEELDMKARLEELKSQINQKEEEVRTKEKYLQQKMEELRMREQGLIREDIAAREQELPIGGEQQKVTRA